MKPVIGVEEIKGIIPHRFENVLLEQMQRGETNGKPSGQGELALTDGDEHGRDIFLVTDSDGSRVYYPFMFLEFFALGSITLMEEKVKQGLTAVFSSIRKVKCNDSVSAGSTLRSDLVLKNISNGFHRFIGSISGDGEPACSLEIMAYGVDFNENDQEEGPETKYAEIPPANTDKPVDPAFFAYKHPALLFADTVHAGDNEQKEIYTRYTYPEDHPFTRGHFPENPIMMGITQAIMFADAVQLLCADCNVSGAITADGEIMRAADGAVVCEIKGMQLEIKAADALPQLTGIKMVAFRDLVTPGTDLICRAKLAD